MKIKRFDNYDIKFRKTLTQISDSLNSHQNHFARFPILISEYNENIRLIQFHKYTNSPQR